MTSIKVKFRYSTVEGKEGSIYFQIIHNRVVRQLNTDYKIYETEWYAEAESVMVTGNRSNILLGIRERLEWDIARLEKVIRQLETERRRYTADDVITVFHKMTKEASLFTFMHGVIAQLKQLGKIRTSETYTATLKSFMVFREEQDVPLDGITSDLMLLYEAYLKARGVHMNTISFYMRILRAVYNRAVEKGLAEQQNPFRHVYTGVDKTVKRAIPIKVIKALKELDLSVKPSLDFARDMFMFSFYTRGMSFVDMAYLKKSDLQNGILTYRRRKTGQELSIKWEKCMAEIVAKYPDNHINYLLPIIKEKENERKQYDNALHLVNYRLKDLSKILKLQRPLTMYVARHSWASAAKAKNVPLSVISEGMGHDSEATTQIYLASLETSVVDKANKMILGLL
ncbi:site-specific integrase [Segatella oris]|uniref:Transposase n=1 Tax=Segatella oris C735 TaxID=563008 RepID=D7NG70_9BACT|nr:site-specific integrase [Segatella oris]EFI47458.1 transposase [Segatella oris C735]